MPSNEEMAAALAKKPRYGFRADTQGLRHKGQAGEFIENYAPAVAEGLATLPDRAIGAAHNMRETGEYNPAPFVETALLLLGARSPFIKRGELGAAGGKPGTVVPVESKPLTYFEYDKLPTKQKVQYWENNKGWSKEEDGWRPSLEAAKAEKDHVSQKFYNVPVISDLANKFVDKINDTADAALIAWNTRKHTNKIMKHIEPMDWGKAAAPNLADRLPLVDVPPVAEVLGFNSKMPLYKGNTAYGKPSESLPDPTKKSYERGVFFSDKKGVAEQYGPTEPFVARAENPAQIDYSKVVPDKSYGAEHMHPIIEAARKKGHDLLAIRNMYDMGGLQDQYVVLNPSIVRKPTAKFDPNRLNENNLLAGITGGAVMSPVIQDYVKALNGE